MKVPVKFYAHFQSIFIAHSKYVSLSRSISGGHIGYPVCPSRQFYLTLRAVCSSFHTILCKQIKHGYSKKLTRASAFPVFLNRKTLFNTVMKAERFNEVASPDGRFVAFHYDMKLMYCRVLFLRSFLCKAAKKNMFVSINGRSK